jgi:uncharacterized protein YjiS (DUF1127 family)
MTQHILTINSYLQSPIEGLLSWVKSVHKSYVWAKNVRQTVKELNQLTNKELQDIGISRGDIYAVASGDTTLKRGVSQ